MKAIFLATFLSALSQAATIQLGAAVPVTSSTFDVDVDVTNVFANFPGEAVTGFGFNVTVTPGVAFSGESVNLTLFTDLSCCVGPDVVGLPNAAAGLDSTDFTEPLLLATLHFTLSGSGPVTVGVTADNGSDPNQGLYFLSGAESFTATETVGSSTPEPATILLSALGLLGVTGMSRLRRIARKID